MTTTASYRPSAFYGVSSAETQPPNTPVGANDGPTVSVGAKDIVGLRVSATPSAPRAAASPGSITLTPITDLEEDLRIQVYDRRMFAEDDQLGQTLKIPLRDLIDNASVEKWYDIEPADDHPLKEGEKSAQIKLSIELHGVKATED